MVRPRLVILGIPIDLIKDERLSILVENNGLKLRLFTVWKKSKIDQRKIPATLLANYLWGPPPIGEDLGLAGGAPASPESFWSSTKCGPLHWPTEESESAAYS